MAGTLSPLSFPLSNRLKSPPCCTACTSTLGAKGTPKPFPHDQLMILYRNLNWFYINDNRSSSSSSSTTIDVIKFCSIFSENSTLFGQYPPSSAQTNASGIDPTPVGWFGSVGLDAPLKMGPGKAVDPSRRPAPVLPFFV